MRDYLAKTKPSGWTPRLYREGDEHRILPLYPLAFQGLTRSLDYWRWKFKENPEGQQTIVGEDADGHIIGQLAGLPTRVWAEGRQLLFTQVVDLMVDPRVRRGLRSGEFYIGLLRAFSEEFAGEGKAALTFGLPNEYSSRIAQAVFGWQVLHQVTRVARSLDTNTTTPSWLSRRRYTIHRLEEFAGIADPLWQRCRGDLPLATIRSAPYLTWRYLRCPHVRYQASVAWDRLRNRPAGLVVLRMGWEGQPLCAVVDWLVPRSEPAAAWVLLRHAETEARRAGMKEVSAWFSPDSLEQRWFLARGYTAEPTRYPLLAKAYATGLAPDWVSRHWYYTMGDTDVF